MHKVFYGTLIAQASGQIKNITPNLVRASMGFLAKSSIDNAIHDLKECQRLLELAKTCLSQNNTNNQTKG